METASILRLLPSNKLRSASPSRTIQLMVRICLPETLKSSVYLLTQERNFDHANSACLSLFRQELSLHLNLSLRIKVLRLYVT